MKKSVLGGCLLVLASCSSGDPCAVDADTIAFAHEAFKPYFPVPEAITWMPDSVYLNGHGERVVRGRVTYTNALGKSNTAKYWVGVACDDGPLATFGVVDWSGPKFGRAD